MTAADKQIVIQNKRRVIKQAMTTLIARKNTIQPFVDEFEAIVQALQALDLKHKVLDEEERSET